MDGIFADTIEYIQSVPVFWAYCVILAAAYGEGVLSVVPGDAVIVFAGFLASKGAMALPTVIAIGTVGGTLGFMTMYYLGRTAGERLVNSPRVRFINPSSTGRVKRWTERWGFWIVLANRFLVAGRAAIAFVVGMGNMNAGITALLSTISAVMWMTLLAWAGFAAGENWERVTDVMGQYGKVILVLIVLWIVFMVWRAKRRRGMKETS